MAFIKKISIIGMVSMALTSCGSFVKLGEVDQKNDKESVKQDITQDKELISFGVSVNDASDDGLALLGEVSDWSIDLQNCESDPTAHPYDKADGAVNAYKFDVNCEIKLNSFVDGNSGAAFSLQGSWSAYAEGSTATFTDAESNSITVTLDQTLDSPISGTESISFSYKQNETGTAEVGAFADFADAHTMSVDGEIAPDYDIENVKLIGVGMPGGYGKLQFKLLCMDADGLLDAGGAADTCHGLELGATKIKLFDKEALDVTSAAALAAGMAGASDVFTLIDDAANGEDIFSTAPSGGVKINLNGPNRLGQNREMYLVMENNGSYIHWLVTIPNPHP